MFKMALRSPKSRQKGASMIEYALIVAAIVAIAGAYFGSGGDITEAIKDKLDAVVSSISGS